MFRFVAVLLCFLSMAHAQVGEIISIKGGADAYLTRSGGKNELTEGFQLEVGDTLRTESSHVVLVLYPKIQMSLVKGTEITITSHMVDEAGEAPKTNSLIELIKGLIRIQVNREGNEEVQQKVNSQNVAFTVRGTEYEVSATADDAELDVFEGEVEVTSPDVQTFVPEIVKRNEGFRFMKKQKSFMRRALKERNKEARFLRKEELRNRWKLKKEDRKARREKRQDNKEERRNARKERKGRGR